MLLFAGSHQTLLFPAPPLHDAPVLGSARKNRLSPCSLTQGRSGLVLGTLPQAVPAQPLNNSATPRLTSPRPRLMRSSAPSVLGCCGPPLLQFYDCSFSRPLRLLAALVHPRLRRFLQLTALTLVSRCLSGAAASLCPALSRSDISGTQLRPVRPRSRWHCRASQIHHSGFPALGPSPTLTLLL